LLQFFPELPATEIPSASLGNVPNWDSLATINLVALIEEQFGIQTEPEDLARLVSFNSIMDYVKRKISRTGMLGCFVIGIRSFGSRLVHRSASIGYRQSSCEAVHLI
jgi:acyl carrier protein